MNTLTAEPYRKEARDIIQLLMGAAEFRAGAIKAGLRNASRELPLLDPVTVDNLFRKRRKVIPVEMIEYLRFKKHEYEEKQARLARHEIEIARLKLRNRRGNAASEGFSKSSVRRGR